jgi:uncharacterized protein (TIGR02996 family)
MTAEEKAFVEALKADPYDRATRLVYSDWLSEHGRDAEAEAQRAWTEEGQRRADAEEVIAEWGSHLPFDPMEVLREFSDDGSYFAGDDDSLGSVQVPDEVWEAYELLEGVRLEEARRPDWGYFRCAC